MNDILIRASKLIDLPRLTEIYNHYVVTTPVTFDLEPTLWKSARRGLSNLPQRDGIVCWWRKRADW